MFASKCEVRKYFCLSVVRKDFCESDESVSDPDTIPDAVKSYNVHILDGTP